MKTGDTVSVIDDNISGKILGIKGDSVTILTQDEFEMQFSKKELVVIEKELTSRDLIPMNFSQIVSEKESAKPNKQRRVKPKERNLPAMEVDLHANQLVRNPNKLSSHELLTLQLDTAKRQLEFAIRKKITRVVFIHGIGEGVLKTELDFLFRRYENMKFYDADYRKYGRGATEVYFLQSKMP